MSGKAGSDRRAMQTILHLGAHRTASTRIQADLDDNQWLLATAGIVALTPPRPGKRAGETIRDIVREAGATMRLRNPVTRHLNIRRLRGRLDRAIEHGMQQGVPVRRLVISDEMLLGPAFTRDGGGLYRSAAERVAAFNRVLGREISEVHLTIRSYDTFLVSVYAMRAVYAGPLPAFAALAPRFLRFEHGWPELVAGIARTLPTARVIVTVFEQQSIASRIADLIGEELYSRFAPTGNAQPNVSPTLEAIETASAAGSRLTDPDALIARHAGGTRFDPLDASEKAALRDRYARDLEVLRQAAGIDLRPQRSCRPVS